MSIHHRTILICPLNWGLGHATRDIPIIRRLLKSGFRVIVASEAPIIQLMQKEIPGIETDYLPGAKITYSLGKIQVWKLFRQLPSALFWLYRENAITAQLVKKYNPVCIISDNRYGVRNKKVKSILITHQLMIKMPNGFRWLERLFHILIKMLISCFNECWIPDNTKTDSLAGDLVHQYKFPKNSKLIGPLSRFMDEPCKSSRKEVQIINTGFKLLVLLSGPEPQRSILQEIISEKIIEEKIPTIMVTGKPDKNDDLLQPLSDWFIRFHHLDSDILKQLIQTSPYIICRSGYTSLMDLWFMGKNVLLIPTPGQTEQEYLALYHKNRHHQALSQTELKKLSLSDLLLKYPLNPSDKANVDCSKSALNGAIDSLGKYLVI